MSLNFKCACCLALEDNSNRIASRAWFDDVLA